MRNAKLIFLGLLVSSLSVYSQSVHSRLDSLKEIYVPDMRTGIFEYSSLNGKLKVKTDQRGALEPLRSFTVDVEILPAAALGKDTFAVVKVPVANLRSNKGHSSELANQALMGTPLRILEKEGTWYRVQTPDKYISYVSSSSFSVWKPKDYYLQPKVVITTPYGFIYTKASIHSEVVSNVTWGDLVILKSRRRKYYEIALPDGREGFVLKSDAQLVGSLGFKSNEIPKGKDLVSTSKKMMGIPYLWGGTSWKGVDCSGFTRTVYFMNGLYLPRDASQQALLGRTIQFNNDFNNIQKGDLLYFGKQKGATSKVTHVAMSLGEAKYIHSSGYVRENSLDPASPIYDAFNANRLLFVKRLEKYTPGLFFLNSKNLYSHEN